MNTTRAPLLAPPPGGVLDGEPMPTPQATDNPTARSGLALDGQAAATVRGEPIPAGVRRIRWWARLVLVPVALIGAALSFQSLYTAATPTFGRWLAAGFPLLVDALILGASLQYVAGAKIGRPRAGWRLTAHAAVAGTLYLNALAAHTTAQIPWHVTAPAVWSVLVELTARDVLGTWRATHRPPTDKIPARLWITAPVESGRTWLRLARRVEGEQATARLEVGLHAAAVEALRLALPGRRARPARRILTRQLRAGSLPPAAVLGPLGWTDEQIALTEITPQAVLRAALRQALLAGPGGGPGPAGPLPGPPSTVTGPPGLTDVRTARGSQEAAMAPDGTATALPTSASLAADRVGVTANGMSARPADSSLTNGHRANGVRHGSHPDVRVATNGVGEAETGRAARGYPSDQDDRAARPAETADFTPLGGRDRLSDAVTLLRHDDALTAPQLGEQLRGLGWRLSDRTAARVLSEARQHRAGRAVPTP